MCTLTPRFLYSFILPVVIMIAGSAHAERFRYIDDAGTIHWADHVGQVPREYQNQVLRPTPVPDERTRQWMEQQRRTREQERARKIAEEKRQEMLEEREQQRREAEAKRKAKQRK